ncbi:MAG: hypothetical protein ABSD68_02105 [Candidatus Micrarchaeales archaeon]|jgi:hypothetical protein
MVEQTTSMKKVLRKSTGSELGGKDVYMKKEVDTVSPSRFSRNLVIGIEELGYKIDDKLDNKIREGELKESDYMNMTITGVKKIVEKEHKNTRLIAGLSTIVVGLVLFFLVPPLGLLAIGLGELSFILWLQGKLKRPTKNEKPSGRISTIWVMIENKNQSIKPTRIEDSQASDRKNKKYEFIVHVAGETNSEKKMLQHEIKSLTDRLEFFV